jgi:hypothetical protein
MLARTSLLEWPTLAFEFVGTFGDLFELRFVRAICFLLARDCLFVFVFCLMACVQVLEAFAWIICHLRGGERAGAVCSRPF